MKQDEPKGGRSNFMPGAFERLLEGISHPLRAYYRLRRATRNRFENFKNSGVHTEETASSESGARGAVSGRPGITVIVLSYDRLFGLRALLDSLLQQELGEIQLELIVCNNSKNVYLDESRFSRIGRLLSKFQHKRIINSSYNWRCRVRYAFGTLATYDTILFLDDDVILSDRNFIQYMFQAHSSLRRQDIVSCWNTLWTEYNEDHFKFVSMTFQSDEVSELTESDTIGPGISMFDKGILFSSKVLRMSEQFEQADDMAFPLIAYQEWGSRSYFLPSSGMLQFHDQRLKNPLSFRHGHYKALYAQYKTLWKDGYQPVLSREPGASTSAFLSAQSAAETLSELRREWS